MSRNRPHHRAPQQLVLVAIVHMLRGLCAATFLGFLVATVLLKDPHLLIGAGIAFACLGISAGIHLAEATKTRCPVCNTALFAHTRCSKHKTASRLIGSYRLHTAAEILARPLFHCHHCGEGVLCKPPRNEVPAKTPAKSHQRAARTLSRVPIDRIPRRNVPSESPIYTRAQTTTNGPTLPS